MTVQPTSRSPKIQTFVEYEVSEDIFSSFCALILQIQIFNADPGRQSTSTGADLASTCRRDGLGRLAYVWEGQQ